MRLAVNFLLILGAACQNRVPILFVIRPITPLAVSHSPANDVHILSSAEQTPEERDLHWLIRWCGNLSDPLRFRQQGWRTPRIAFRASAGREWLARASLS